MYVVRCVMTQHVHYIVSIYANAVNEMNFYSDKIRATS